MSIIAGNIDRKKMFEENRDFYVEIFCEQKNHHNEHICGDVFRSKRIKSEDRIIAVLSDGLGHGVKANVLATFTTSFAINFTEEHKDFEKIADIIMNTLPVCAERKISYSTFTIVDIDLKGKIKILGYDNPDVMLFRYNMPMDDIKWEELEMTTEKNRGKILKTASFSPQKGDRIVFCSDGVSQSGLGSELFPFGWETENCKKYILKLITNDPYISAGDLSYKVVSQAFSKDRYIAKDDISCATIYFRDPRKCLICTGPPYNQENDPVYADIASHFKGTKIICGGTSSEIIARELNLKIREKTNAIQNTGLPPQYELKGFDMVTEGILTLSKINSILDKYNSFNFRLGYGPADKIVSALLNSDEVCFLVGTSINIIHQDPDLPMDLEIRRTVIGRIARKLDETFMKEVKIIYM